MQSNLNSPRTGNSRGRPSGIAITARRGPTSAKTTAALRHKFPDPVLPAPDKDTQAPSEPASPRDLVLRLAVLAVREIRWSTRRLAPRAAADRRRSVRRTCRPGAELNAA